MSDPNPKASAAKAEGTNEDGPEVEASSSSNGRTTELDDASHDPNEKPPAAAAAAAVSTTSQGDTVALSRSQDDARTISFPTTASATASAKEDTHPQHQRPGDEQQYKHDFLQLEGHVPTMPEDIHFNEDQSTCGISTITGVAVDNHLYPSAFAVLRADDEIGIAAQQQPVLEDDNHASRGASLTSSKGIHKKTPMDGHAIVKEGLAKGVPVVGPASKRNKAGTNDATATGNRSTATAGGSGHQSLTPEDAASDLDEVSTTLYDLEEKMGTKGATDTIIVRTPGAFAVAGVNAAAAMAASSDDDDAENNVDNDAGTALPRLSPQTSDDDLVTGIDNRRQDQQRHERPDNYYSGAAGATDGDGATADGNDIDAASNRTRDTEHQHGEANNNGNNHRDNNDNSHSTNSNNELAQATVVEEDQPSTLLQLPVASPIEELRNKRGSQFQQWYSCFFNRYFALGMSLLAIVVVVIVVVVVVVVRESSGANSSAENLEVATPAEIRAEEIRRLRIHTRIVIALDAAVSTLPPATATNMTQPMPILMSNSQLLYEADPNANPYSKALQWILDIDPMHLPATADNLLQRYYMVLFYFSTIFNEDQEWAFCNPRPASLVKQEDDDDDDGDDNDLCYYNTLMSQIHEGLLTGIYNNVQGVNHQPGRFTNYQEVLATRWVSGAHECMWAGLLCTNQKVTQLHLTGGMNLTGTFPPEIGTMVESLKSIAVPYNFLEGPIPSGIASLKNLEYLDVEGNYLTGHFMDPWMVASNSLENLFLLNLAYNPLDAWAIPTNIAAVMPNLTTLLVQSCAVDGSIPTEIAELSQLSWLSLAGNDRLTSTIPTEIGLMTNLREIFLGYSMLSGTIPTEIAQLTRLEFLEMSSMALTGTIPEELWLGDLDDLLMLDIGINYLTGTISSSISNLWRMGFLYLDANFDLTGTIPTEIGLLEGLQKLHLDETGLSGSIPRELCALWSSYLYLLKADCIVDSETGDIPVQCEEGCCNRCCDRSTGFCEKYD